MRRNSIARIIIGAAALTLLASSMVAAQAPTPPPDPFGATLRTTVITNALDHAPTNELIEQTAHDFHVDELGGKANSSKKNGWFPVVPQPSTDGVTESVLDASQRKNHLIIISGGDGQVDVGIAGNFQSTVFVDLGQQRPCVTESGQADPSGTCDGGVAGIPLNYSAVDFAVEDGAYLTGVLGAAASHDGRLGIISGTAECNRCNRYIQGFVTGARSVDPDIDIELAYLADDEVAGFGDPVSAKTFTEAFIDVYQPDVLLPVGRGATTGMIEAACESGDVLVVGTDIDVSAAHPDLAECLLTSVTTDIATAVRESMHAFANGLMPPEVVYDLVNDRVAVTDEWKKRTLPVDTRERYKDAETGILTGQIDTCPLDCGAPFSLDGQGAGGEEATTGDAGEGDTEEDDTGE